MPHSLKRLISGIQPTGHMHLGNYLGAVANWVTLQDQFESFFFIADLHSLTTLYENPVDLADIRWNMAIDLLASGIDPKKSHLFIQSDVAEHSELHLILSMMTPLSWLTRVPSYKGKLAEIKDKDLNTYGFLGYPVLMAADILLYKGEMVPVGQDQLAHLELTREIARRFNSLYHKNVFPMPAEKLTQVPMVLGTDGRKMSKSYGNTIPVNLSADEMEKKVLKMLTDPARVRRNDPGHPDQCPVFSYHQIFNSKDRNAQIDADCRSAAIGCVDCKRECAARINASLAEFRKKRQYFEAHPDEVKSILETGAAAARKVARDTMAEVRGVIGF